MITTIITHKTCPKCSVAQPLQDFYKNKSTADGLSNYCKECAKAVLYAARQRPREIRDNRLRCSLKMLTRVFSKIQVSSTSFHNGHPCWEWQGCIDRDGYGIGSYNTAWVVAYRLTYEMFVEIIPEHLQIDHLCRNRACVNPAHLEAVTGKVNTLRGNSFSAINARKVVCNQGHPFSPENTYIYKTGRSCRTCGRRHVRNYSRRVKEQRLP